MSPFDISPTRRDELRQRYPELALWTIRTRRSANHWKTRDRIESNHYSLPSLNLDLLSAEASPSSPPVFVLSAGWRSGSTAVQRLLSSSPELFVWGEPYTTGQIPGRLESILRQSAGFAPNNKGVLHSSQISPALSREWIATAYPEEQFLVLAIRRFYEAAFWSPLGNRGYRTWGLKEVCLTPDLVTMLRAVFPDARFVLLVRDPRDAYHSFRRFVAGAWAPYGRHDRLAWVSGPRGFARVWTSLATEFRESSADDNTLVVRHEDIAGNPDFPDTLARFAGVPVDAEAWNARVEAWGGYKRGRWSRAEGRVLWSLVHEEAAHWGYGPR